MQKKNIKKNLAMLVITIIFAVTISGFASATEHACDSDKCICDHAVNECTCKESCCDKECNCHDQKIDEICEKPEKCNSTIGDRVWNDSNNNGIQDPDETGIANVTVNLWKGDEKGPIEQIATTKTDENGNYFFSNLVAGIYWLEFKAPEGVDGTWIFSPQNQGTDDSTDSDANATGIAGPICIKCCVCDPSWDAGLVFFAAAGGEEPTAAGGEEIIEIPVAAAGEELIEMQETGVPVGMFTIAVLMVLTGLVLPKIKK